jgi:ABC-type Zn2+ transport system substrate-binding protein/surface adhesin
MLQSALASGVLALFVSGAGLAAMSDVGAPADATVVAVTDADQLNELAEANDVDHGMEHEVENGADHDANDHDANDHDVNDQKDLAEQAENNAELNNEVAQSAAEANEAQQDAVEAAQEHNNEHGGNSGPGA